jgi:hypothetical protein
MKPGGAFAAAAAAVIAATVLFAPGASGQDPGIPPLVEPSPEGSSESVVVENPLEPGLFEDPPAVAPDSGGQTVLVRGPQANSGAISVALCPAGTHVISGGYHVVANRQSNSGENYDLVDISAPMPAETVIQREPAG